MKNAVQLKTGGLLDGNNNGGCGSPVIVLLIFILLIGLLIFIKYK